MESIIPCAPDAIQTCLAPLCGTYTRVYQFVLLTYACVLGAALAAYRYQRLGLIHQRSALLAVKTLCWSFRTLSWT